MKCRVVSSPKIGGRILKKIFPFGIETGCQMATFQPIETGCVPKAGCSEPGGEELRLLWPFPCRTCLCLSRRMAWNARAKMISDGTGQGTQLAGESTPTDSESYPAPSHN